MEDFGWGVTGLIIVLILALLVVSTFQNTTRELLIRTCEAELPRDHWFWYHAETDRESAIHWDKWAVYRWAKEQFAQDNGSDAG